MRALSFISCFATPALWASFFLAVPLAADTVVVINEFKSDPPGSDTREFIELFACDDASGEAAGHFPLDGYVLVLFNGSSAVNAAYAVTPVGGSPVAALYLDGHRTNAAGFFVIGSPDVAEAGLVVAPGSTGWLQNGPDGVGLYRNPSATFTTGTSPTAEGLVDAVVYGTDDPEDYDLLEVLTPGASQVNESPNSVPAMARMPDGGAPFFAGAFIPRPPTPGSRNQPVAGLALSVSSQSLTEGTAGAGRVTRTGSTAAPVTVSFASSDPMTAPAPAAVEIPAGSDHADVVFGAADDLWPNGEREVEITATAPDYVAASLRLTVNDDGDAPQPVVINEVFASGIGDANHDGANSTSQHRHDDEFVEIVNRGSEPFDLSGFRIFAASIDSPRHTIPEGTRLAPGAALVVFGGGQPPIGITEDFGNAWIQRANAPELGLYLLEPAGRVSLRNRQDLEIAGFHYDHQSGAVESLTLSPDIDGTPAPHGSLGDGSWLFSPGTRFDGTPFSTVAHRLDCRIEPPRVAENAGAGAASLIVTRAGPATEPLVVTVLALDPTEAAPRQSSFIIPGGAATGSVPIDAVDDIVSDGTQLAGFLCIAAGHLNGAAALEVEDDGIDRPPLGVFINEIDSDQPGADTGEFIELYVGEPAARPLDGYLVVLFNGNHASNGAYAVIDLSGKSSNARGFFVIGNAGVPNVDLVIPNASIQNGADAVAVYRAPASAFTTGASASPPMLDDLVDVVIYGNASGEDADLLEAFQAPGHPSSPVLVQHDEGGANNPHALARVPDAVSPWGTFIAQPPTPGFPNSGSPGLPPAIDIAIADDHVVLTFTGTLEAATTLQENAFAPVPGATSPHRLPLPLSGSRFFRATSR